MIVQEQLIQLEELGSGQFGTVYRFSDGNNSYAGKVIYNSVIPGYPDVFVDQIIDYSRSIKHKSPNAICYNIETFEGALQLDSNGLPIIFSELLTENLDNYVMRMNGKCAIHTQMELCHDMAKGLQYLHSISIVHSNLHGRNILISSNGRAKIADYLCPGLLPNGADISPENVPYLSSEVIEDMSQCAEPSDIYSLGVLFLQVAIQDIPSPTDKTEYSKIMKRREELSKIKHHPLWSIIKQCLSSIRIARPSINQSCEQIVAAKAAPQSVISTALEKTVSDVILNLFVTNFR